jgi:hypothetical protein
MSAQATKLFYDFRIHIAGCAKSLLSGNTRKRPNKS